MSKIRIDAILFDKDGTIINSEFANKTAWMTSMTEHGVDFSEADYQTFVGVPTQKCFDMARDMLPKDFDWEAFFSTLRTNIRKHYDAGVPFKPGFEDFFAHIKTLKLPIGLVTSAERKGTELSFKRSGYLTDFNTIVTIEDVDDPKPAPAPYLLACRKLNVAPEHTLVFEDSSVGLQSAISAGCITVAIPDLVDLDVLIKNQCYRVLTSFSDAYELF
ncbi:HAD family hydrolase [Glaciecola siphonariae]|uniref:HAD family hydrolase n=1 Tax=Glaciecola siphonariae TaxID=521012 RepID=A0ABV9LVL3_9ALTE